MRLTIEEAIKATGLTRKDIKSMISSSVGQYRRRDGVQSIIIPALQEIAPTIKAKVQDRINRGGKRVAVLAEAKGKCMIYRRNPMSALSMTAGLTPASRGAALVILDLMALQGGQPIKIHNHQYICGQIGITAQMWARTILPELLAAKVFRVEKAAGGVKLLQIVGRHWVEGSQAVIQKDAGKLRRDQVALADGPLDLEEVSQRLREQQPSVPPDEFWGKGEALEVRHIPRDEPYVEPDDDPAREKVTATPRHRDLDRSLSVPEDAGEPMVPQVTMYEPVLPPAVPQDVLDMMAPQIAEGLTREIDDIQPPKEVILQEPSEATMTRREEIIARGLEEQERAGTERIEALQERGQIIPASRISVADILKCMGIDPSRHPKGPLFWGRAEHAEHLRRWQEQIDDEMIVGRLHVALSNGDIERHPNTLRAWNEAVGFKISETE